MRLPDSFLDALRQSNDIVQTMSGYVELKRAGKDYVCLCPFHSERTASCHIYTDTQSFYCFGCGVGGDVINFIRQIEHLDYMESVRFLAQRAGLSMPEEGKTDDTSKKRARLLEMNRAAARYFRDTLLAPEGKEGLDYLKERQLTDNTIRKYGLGFAPDGWHDLQFHLKKMGYSDDEMIDGALLVKKNNSSYDKFRRRVMFPIIDRRGNVIAFGGRTLEKDAPAKYLNSDETLVFRKRENLFSLNFAKDSKEKRLILCEGYMDVITLNQAGFDTAVATLGTAITPQQANVMRSYASEVIISYDADGAGQKATMKAINLLSEVGLNARVLNIPNAKDPDEYIKKFGADSFRKLLDNTGTALDHEFGLIKQGLDMNSAAGKAELLRKAVDFLAGVSSDTDRAIYVSETARLTGQQPGTVRDLVDEQRRKNKRYAEKREDQAVIRGSPKLDKINPEAVNFPREEKAERGIIAFLMHSPDKLRYIEKQLQESDFPTEFNRKVYSYIANGIRNGENVDLSSIGAEFTPEETGRITGICRNADITGYSMEQLDEYIAVLTDHREKVRESEMSLGEMSDEEFLALMEAKSKRKKA